MSSESNHLKAAVSAAVLVPVSAAIVVLVVSAVFPLTLGMYGAALPEHESVDKHRCTCDCWDGMFKGTYGRGGYKAMYFNMDPNMVYILLDVVLYAVIATNAAHGAILMVLRRQPLSPVMAVGVLCTLYPNFYGFFMVLNYYNDRMYDMMYTQLFFCVTELVNACCLYALIPLRSDLKHRERIVLLWTPVAIGWLHFLLSMSNEAMGNLLSGKEIHLAGRDLGFLIGDVGVIVCAAIGLHREYMGVASSAAQFKRHLSLVAAAVATTFCVYQLIPNRI